MSYADACQIATFIINIAALMYAVRKVNEYERLIRDACYRRRYRGPRPPWERR